jgi:hypothetical protein
MCIWHAAGLDAVATPRRKTDDSQASVEAWLPARLNTLLNFLCVSSRKVSKLLYQLALWKTWAFTSGQNSLTRLEAPSIPIWKIHFCPVLVQVRSRLG